MGWLIAACILTVLALLPLGVRIRYDASGPFVALIAGPVKIQIIPAKPKEKTAKANAESVSDKPQNKKSKIEKKSAGGSVADFLPLLQIVLNFLEGFRRKLRVDHLQLKLILGGADPCELALNYGKGWAALGNLMPLMERFLVIKKRNLEVECDFTADQTTIIAGADLTIRIWRLVSLAVAHGPRAIKTYLGIMKIRKGGANT